MKHDNWRYNGRDFESTTSGSLALFRHTLLNRRPESRLPPNGDVDRQCFRRKRPEEFSNLPWARVDASFIADALNFMDTQTPPIPSSFRPSRACRL